MAGSRARHSGIRKHQRRDREGDVIMGAAPRVTPARPSPRDNTTTSSGPRASSTPTAAFTELTVTGWTDNKEMTKLIGFLERHSSRRSPKASKGNTMPPKMIKRHKVSTSGNVLTIFVRPEDVSAFSKINGFTFTSEHGAQKLNIAGPGIRIKESAMEISTTGEGDRQDDKSPEAIRALMGRFIERRYMAAEKLLNFSTIAQDEEVASTGMFTSASTQEKFFPVLMAICNEHFGTAERKCELVHSVTLNGNNLPTLGAVRNLATTFPNIKNLDLSGNQFASIRDLKPWKNRFRQLEHLIVEIAEPGWEEEITSWFPKLKILNTTQVRPADGTTTTTTQAGLSETQEQMVIYVQEQTKLKREVAIQCLEAGGWNIDAAAALFLAQKDSLPQDSFN
jgi:hypothetical protein